MSLYTVELCVTKITNRSCAKLEDTFVYWEGNKDNSPVVPNDIVSQALVLLQELQAQEVLDNCKDEAKKRIAATDWSVLPDVGLANVAAFETYRAALRELIKNPVADPVWPTEPQPIWS